MFRQHFQDPLDYLFMFLLYLCKDQNIVQVYYHDLFGYEGPEDVVHHSLEDGRTVGHSKEHYKRFKEAMIGMKGCLPFVSRLDTYVIETPLDVDITNFIWPYLHQFFIDSYSLNGYRKLLKRPFDRYQSRFEAINNGRDIRQINW